jgi:hypothetical protein
VPIGVAAAVVADIRRNENSLSKGDFEEEILYLALQRGIQSFDEISPGDRHTAPLQPLVARGKLLARAGWTKDARSAIPPVGSRTEGV